MIDKTWQVMNDLQVSFNNVTTIDYLIERLEKAVNEDDTTQIVDITAALTAFYPIYVSDFDEKFRIAWCHVVGTPKELSTSI